MDRHYQFGDIILAVTSLPEGIRDENDLTLFRVPPQAPTLTLAVEPREVREPLEQPPGSRLRYFHRDGTLYLAAEFSYAKNAVVFAPSRWERGIVDVSVHPDILREDYFTVNQLLSLSGFHSGLLHRRCGTLHCSYIRHRGRAILFAGFSGAGKSTQAELWRRERGAEVINGDRALVFPRAAGWCAGGVSVCGSSKICRNETAPLAAIVLLEQGPENVILPMTAAARYRAVLAGLAFHRWSKAETALAGHLAMDLIGAVPVLRLRNRADLGAVEALERAMGGLHEDV